MNIVSTETKLVLFKKFRLFTEMLRSLSDSKKQIKYVKKIIFTECRTINDEQYLLNEKDAAEIEVFVSELKEIAVRFAKAKNTDNYNRAKELLNRFDENLENGIRICESEQSKEKRQGFVANAFQKVKDIESAFQKVKDIENTVVQTAATIKKEVVDTVKSVRD